MTDAIRAAIEGASRYLTDHPDEARYTDSAATATVGDALAVTVVGTAGERLQTDMPASVGGGGAAPGPGWVFRASVAACVASLVAMRASQVGLAGLSCEVEVDSESDDRGILGLDPAVPAGPLSVRIAVRLTADAADPTALEAVAAWAVERCPVSDAVQRAVPIRVEVSTG